MFKWAVFNSEQAAIDLKNSCNSINQGEISFTGSPLFDVPTAIDYTIVIKHFRQPLWAVPLDERAQDLFSGGMTLQDPDPSWFAGPHIPN